MILTVTPRNADSPCHMGGILSKGTVHSHLLRPMSTVQVLSGFDHHRGHITNIIQYTHHVHRSMMRLCSADKWLSEERRRWYWNTGQGEISLKKIPVLLFFFVSFLLLLFRVAPMAYGGSQTRGCIGVAAASLHHSHSKACSSAY